MLGIVFSIDICTLHRISSKNVDLNICAHTWHSVSVMGHKQSFDLAVPVLTMNNLFITDHTLFEVSTVLSKKMSCSCIFS